MKRRYREAIFTGAVWLLLVPLGCAFYLVSALDDWRERADA